MSLDKCVLVEKTVMNYDIVCIQETWNTSSRCIEFQDFRSFHFNIQKVDENAHRGASGISIFIKKNILTNISIIRSHDDFVVWFTVNTNVKQNVKPLLVGVVYFPPEGSTCNVNRDDYFQVLENDICDCKRCNIPRLYECKTKDTG